MSSSTSNLWFLGNLTTLCNLLASDFLKINSSKMSINNFYSQKIYWIASIFFSIVDIPEGDGLIHIRPCLHPLENKRKLTDAQGYDIRHINSSFTLSLNSSMLAQSSCFHQRLRCNRSQRVFSFFSTPIRMPILHDPIVVIKTRFLNFVWNSSLRVFRKIKFENVIQRYNTCLLLRFYYIP